MTLYTENVADQTDYFADAFVREKNIAYGYDVVTFESTQPTPFCLEKLKKKMEKYNVLAAFSVRIVLE